MTAAPALRTVAFQINHPPLLATNTLMRMHWSAYQEHVKLTAALVQAALAQQGLRTGVKGWEALRYVEIRAVLRKPGTGFDADAKHAALKGLIDALKLPHPKTNPTGLGVIVDDSDGEHGAPGYIRLLEVRQIKGDPAVFVEIREVEA